MHDRDRHEGKMVVATGQSDLQGIPCCGGGRGALEATRGE